MTLNLKEEEQPDVYLNVLPVVTAENAGLHVQIPETNETSWRYELSIGDKKITGSADGNTFTITGAESGKEYLFKCISSDGTTQLQTVTGKTEAGNVGIAYGQTLDEKQKALSEKLKEKDKMTWLFMGDSITHAALWTKGYDGIAQTFEKYLKDEMGRASDFKNANANVEYRFKRSEYTAVYCKNEAGRRRAEPDLYRSVYGTSKSV